MDISLEDIRHGLRTFDSTFFQAPGRMNIYDEHPFRVILDYAHNPAAASKRCATLSIVLTSMAASASSVLAAPGDRRDEDIRDIAEIASGHFDHYICRCDDNRRGRGDGRGRDDAQGQVARVRYHRMMQIEVYPRRAGSQRASAGDCRDRETSYPDAR